MWEAALDHPGHPRGHHLRGMELAVIADLLVERPDLGVDRARAEHPDVNTGAMEVDGQPVRPA